MCRVCWELIVKADDDEFLDSLDLTNIERDVLEELYSDGESAVADLLELQGQALNEAIQEMDEDLLTDVGELFKVILSVQSGELFQTKFEQLIYDAFMPLFHAAGETELTALNPDKIWSVKNKAAVRFARKLKKLVPDMNDSTANILLNSFQKAIKEGKTATERAQLVQEVSSLAAKGEAGPFTMQRAVRISRTMSTAAANGGKLEGWKQSEVVKKKRWRSARQKGRTREDHYNADGQEVPLDEPFLLGKNKEKLMHPGDPNGSAKQIVHCRCSMQAVMD
jgi:6-pyruvoyl-tetrahydropterin synthase